MSTPYPQAVNIVIDGEAVNATVTNRPINQLAARTESNREKIDNGLFGSALIAYDVPVDSDTKPGYAVYVGANGAYHKALAQVSVDSATDFQLNETCFVAGIVLRKNTSTTADVILQGVATIAASDFTAASLDGYTVGKPFYLGGDNTKPGRITQTRPLIHVPIGSVHGPNADGTVTVVVTPAPRPDLHNHIHYRAPLVMVNAGNTVATAGWLNATSGNFPGKVIPVGAVYGYNINADPNGLADLWPPIPIYSVYLERNGKGIRINGNAGEVTCRIDSYGIWWMDSCVTNQPFGKAAISDGSGCVTYPDRLDLWFSKLTSVTDLPIVTSITPANNTIIIKNDLGLDAVAGDLFIKSIIPLEVGSSNNGYITLKGVESSSNGNIVVRRGPVVAGVRSTDAAFTITGTTTIDAFDPADGSTTRTFQTGYLNVDFDPPVANREGGMNMLVFDNTELAMINDIPHYVLRAGRASKIRAQLRVPTIGISAGMSLQFKFMFYSGITGQFPDLSISTRIIRPAGSTCTNTALPAVDTALETLSFSGCNAAAGQYFEKLVTTTLTVNPGDLVYLIVNRGSVDAFVGDVGILDVKWSLS
jgi:hypothetical protein